MQGRATHCIDLLCSTAIIRVLVLYVACAADAPRLYKSPDCWLSQSLCAVESNRVICSPWKNAVQRHAKRGRGRKASSLPPSSWQQRLEDFQGCFAVLNAETFAKALSCHGNHDAQRQAKVAWLEGCTGKKHSLGADVHIASTHSTASKSSAHSCVAQEDGGFSLPPKLISSGANFSTFSGLQDHDRRTL